MRFEEIRNKTKWNNLVTQANGSFLQSWEWGEFQSLIGREVLRLAVFSGNRLILAIQIILHRLPLRNFYLYAPRGPILGAVEKVGLGALRFSMGKIKRRGFFLRIEPEKISPKALIGNGFLELGFSIQPKKVLLLDLKPSEKELLARMHSKTRYNINLALKKGVSVFHSNSLTREQFEDFWNLVLETSVRDKFKPYPKDYYRALVEILGQLGLLKIFWAEFENEVLAATLLVFWGRSVVYLHGAGTLKRRELMAPYLLHWQGILAAKKLGFDFYDFGGIDEVKWPGLSRFKKGFGGSIIEYPGAFDYVFDKKRYWLYKFLRWLMRK